MHQLILKENQPFIETLEQAELIIRRAGIVLDELVLGQCRFSAAKKLKKARPD